MAKVFVSYAREDREAAALLVRALEQQGWDVWWDDRLQAAKKFTPQIKEQLRQARCLVVLWSKASVASDYVRFEASQGEHLGRGSLVQVKLAEVMIPPPFNEEQAVDLAAWAISAEQGLLRGFLHTVGEVVQPPDAESMVRDQHELLQRHAALGTLRGDLPFEQLSSHLSHYFAQTLDRPIPGGQRDGVFGYLAELVAGRPRGFSLRVQGESGTGKSVLLAHFYDYLLRRREADPACPFPFFLHLSEFDASEDPPGAVQRDLERAEALVRQYRDWEFVFLIDGYDEPLTFREQVERVVRMQTRGFRQVVGVNLGLPGSEVPKRLHWPFEEALTLRPLARRDAAVPSLLDSFLPLTGEGGVRVRGPALRDALERYRFTRVDLRTLALLDAMVFRSSYSDARDTAALMYHYFRDYLFPRLRRYGGWNDVEPALAEASRLAYESFILGRRPTPEEERQRPAWRMVHHHLDLRDFLVANYVASVFLGEVEDSPEAPVLENLFSYEVTGFCKQILNRSLKTQNLAVQRAQGILASGGLNSQANVSYFLGRLEHGPAQVRAKKLLRQLLNSQLMEVDAEGQAEGASRDESLLFLRTVYVSLIYLGDDKASDQYLERLTRDESWDRVNRGFHLEYYGDIPLDSMQQALHEDPGVEFPRTYERLYGALKSSLDGDAYAPRDLDTFTLFSLAQHRHAQGRLDSTIRENLVALGKQLRPRLGSQALVVYLDMLLPRLASGAHPLGSLLRDLYRIKVVPRAGWKWRGITDAETVAAHMYGAFLLGFCFLPESDPDPDYDKAAVLEMVLVHDLAESETEDIRSKNEQQILQENGWFERFEMTRTFTALPGAARVGELWREFRSQATLNARLAHDLDKLDAYVQLQVYHARQPVADFAEWREEVRGGLRTEQGRALFRKVDRWLTEGEVEQRHLFGAAPLQEDRAHGAEASLLATP